MQNADKTISQLKQAQENTTIVQSDTKKDLDNKKNLDVKNKVELFKAKIPLPINKNSGWIIKTGDLALLDLNQSEIIIYEKKVEGEIAEQNAALKEISDKHNQESLATQLTHVAVSNLKTVSHNPVSCLQEVCGISAFYLILVFKGDPKEIKANSALCNEVFVKHRWMTAFFTMDDKSVSERLLGVSPSLIGKLLYLPIGYFREKFANELFDFLIQKDIFSPLEANYFKEICSPYQSISRFEQETMEAISKALKARSFDKVIKDIKDIHANAIEKSKGEKAFLNVVGHVAPKLTYFDQAEAAFVFGEKLLNLSLKHALQAFDVIEEGSPYFLKKLEIVVNFCLVRKQELYSLDPNTRRSLIQFLANNLDASALSEEDEFVKTINLIFNFLEQQVGYQSSQEAQPFLLKVSDINGSGKIFSGNILSLADRLYDFNSVKDDQAKSQKENHDVVIQKPGSTQETLKTLKSSAETSTLPSTTATTKTLSETSKVISEAGAIAKISLDPAPTHSSSSSSSSIHSTVILSDPKTANDKSDLEQNFVLKPPNNWTITHGDRKKFEEDKSDIEFIRLERKILAEQSKTQIKVVDSSGKERNDSLVFSTMVVARLKIMTFNKKTFKNDFLRKGIVLVLIASDPSMSKGSIGPIPPSLIEKLYEQDEDFDFLDEFESYYNVKKDEPMFSASAEQVGGSRMLCYEISDMREYSCDLLFNMLSNAQMISLDEACAIKELIKPWIKMPSQQELQLLQKMDSNVTKAKALHQDLIRIQQNTKTTENEKVKQDKNALALIKADMHKALDTAIEIAADIHRLTVEENRSQGLYTRNDATIPLIDSDVGLKLGKDILLLSAAHAFRAFELITEESDFSSQASGYIASTGIDLACNSTSEKERRTYRASALKALSGVNEHIDMFLKFLEVHAGYENLGGKGLFSNLKAQALKKTSVNFFIQILLILCDQLSELNKLSKKNRPLKEAEQTNLSLPTNMPSADMKAFIAALSTSTSSSSSSSSKTTLTTSVASVASVATEATATPITFLATAVATKKTSTVFSSSGHSSANSSSNSSSSSSSFSSKTARSLEDCSDEEEDSKYHNCL